MFCEGVSNRVEERLGERNDGIVTEKVAWLSCSGYKAELSKVQG